LVCLWILVCASELIVWNLKLRNYLFTENPVIEISASLLNDLIWVLPALALPLYIIYLIFKGTGNKIARLSFCFSGLLVYILAFMDLGNYFRYLLYLLIPFVSLFVYHLLKIRPLRLHTVLFMGALCGLFLHYKIQLIPKLPFIQSPGDSTLSILTYNIKTYQPVKNQLKCVQFIKKSNADLVFVQEMDANLRKLIELHLSAYYPYQLWADKSFDYTGGLILSRVPFISSTNIQMGTTFSSGLSNLNHATIRFQDQEINLFNCHLFHGAHLFLDLVRQEKNRLTRWQKFLEASQRHRGEALQLAGQTSGCNTPIILVGDFNNTPNSHVYRLFSHSMHNAFEKAGWGLGTTYGYDSVLSIVPKKLHFLIFDFLRIDHIFCSSHFNILSAQVFSVDGSDHRPMLIKVRLVK
jgi:endonuclease/exonuclease/phosphatase (EEP) superfamily protein YafD